MGKRSKSKKTKGGAHAGEDEALVEASGTQNHALVQLDQGQDVAGAQTADGMSSIQKTQRDQEPSPTAKRTKRIGIIVIALCVLIVVLSATVVVLTALKVHAARQSRDDAKEITATLRIGSETIEELRAATLNLAAPTLQNQARFDAAVTASRVEWAALKKPSAALLDDWDLLETDRAILRTLTLDELVKAYKPFLNHVLDVTVKDSKAHILTSQRERAIAGVSCVMTELVPVMDSYLIAGWSNIPPGLGDSNLAQVVAANHAHFSACVTEFLPVSGLGKLNPPDIPTLSIPSGLIQYNTTPGSKLTLEQTIFSFDRRLDAIRTIMRVSADRVDSAASRALLGTEHGATTPLILGLFLCIVSMLTLIVSIQFLKGLLKATDKLETDRVFSSMDDRPKPMQRYVEVVQSVTLRPSDTHLGGEIPGVANLREVLLFAQSLRPFVMQSSLGELESITLSGGQVTSKGILSGGGATSEFQALQEIQMRELRTEVGLQNVLGTVMAIQLSPFCSAVAAALMGTDVVSQTQSRGATTSAGTPSMASGQSKQSRQHSLQQQSMAAGGGKNRIVFGSEAPAELSRWVRETLRRIIHLINSSGGVVHSINGDVIYALWNVCGIADGAHKTAIDCALRIQQLWQPNALLRNMLVHPDHGMLASDAFDTGTSAHRDSYNTYRKLGSVERPSIGIAQSILVAGNIETLGVRNQLVVVGPAMVKAAMALRLCSPLGSSIVIDSTIADQYSTLNGSSLEHCVREGVPVITGPNDDEEELFYAVQRFRLKVERLAVWRAVFKEIMKLKSVKAPPGSVQETIKLLNRFKQGIATANGDSKKSGRTGSSHASSAELQNLANDPIASFWIRRLEKEVPRDASMLQM